jgi:predicted RNase H-like HicB family nuclease
MLSGTLQLQRAPFCTIVFKSCAPAVAYNEDMKFRVVIEFDPDVNSYSAICPELPGCASVGDTEDEARVNIEEAIRLYLAPAEISLPDNAKLSEVTIG